MKYMTEKDKILPYVGPFTLIETGLINNPKFSQGITKFHFTQKNW